MLMALMLSCSTRKDRFLNRTAHATTTKFNVLYNGRMAFDKAKKQLDDEYKDDFFKILPIEPLKIKETLEMPKGPKSLPTTNNATSTAAGFDRAEEKAVKAVQKHSMNIGGTEKNKQIDDAYFLLGKARYFDQRFVPALETFAYIIKHYPKSALFNEARIWEAKCLTRLQNEDQAIYNLDLLLELKDTPDQIKADALTALAMAYVKQDSTEMVIELLDSTLLYKTKNHNQKARNLFILGQLYRKTNQIDSSNVVFNQLTNFKKAPYRFKIYSQLERAKNYNKETDNTEELVASLEKLSRNSDNRKFLDGILYQLGKINLANDKVDKATCQLKKALHTKISNENVKSLAYEELGNVKFDQANFLDAGSYYDSVLSISSNKNTKRMRRLIRKRKSLDEVIRLENRASKNDSILKLSHMGQEEQTAFFTRYIKDLKKRDEEAKNIAQNEKASGFGNSLIQSGSKQSVKGGKFYFYNAQTVGFGQAEFKKIWGERDLADNWRLSNKKTIKEDEIDVTDTVEEEIDESKKYDVNYYVAKIPTNKKVLDSLASRRNDAYYKLGVIYKEKFNKAKLATTKLEKLLEFSPSEDLVLPTYYHLYKAFESFNMQKSDFYKNKITSDYAESRYAQIINNPDFIADENADENTPENAYKETYKEYLDENYIKTLSHCKKYIATFANTDIVPKFELLKAYAIAKTKKDKKEFIKALTFVVQNYPNLEEGIHAAKVIASLKGESVPVKKIKKKVTKKPVSKTKKMVKSAAKSTRNLPSNEKMLELIKKNKKR